MKNKIICLLPVLILLAMIPNVYSATNLQEGDWITYKIEINFEGLDLETLIFELTGYEHADLTELYTLIDYIEQTYLNVTVLAVSGDTLDLSVYFYLDETHNWEGIGDYTIGSETLPFIVEPNINASQVLSGFTLPTELEQYLTLTYYTTTKFYAGQNRVVNTADLYAQNILQHLNASEIPDQLQGLGVDIQLTCDWDKEYGIFLGICLSLRITAPVLSWFSYTAIRVYALDTNLWGANPVDQIGHDLTSLFGGYTSRMATYAIDGFVFGNGDSQVMFILHMLGITVTLSIIALGLYYIIRKRRK